jgi:PAS domain S-box-containing protein
VDIRTKLIFALVAVALMSMFVMGAVVSSEVRGFMRDGRLEQLDELAESRSQALLWIVEGWRDRADLIASRTQLRASLDEYERAGAPAAARIQAILDDAIDASRSPTLVRVYDAEGRLVASVTRRNAEPLLSRELPAAPIPPAGTEYVGVDFDGSGSPQVTFITPMTWDERLVGSLVSTFEARELLELTGAYQGLGETGETVVFAEDADGVPRTLHPTRDEPGGRAGVVLPVGPGSLASRALDAGGAPPSDALVDHRGEAVWAATRLVGDTGWGLIVKVDAVEEQRPYAEFNDWLTRTALILAAFAILAGFAFGMRFAMPIHALAEVANRIRGGDMQARAKVAVEDEVGALTRTFNEMADELEQRMELLREFRKFFDVSIDLMCIAGTDGYFKRVNPAFPRVLGWTEEELLTKPFFDFVHPDDVEKTQMEVAKLVEGIPTISFQNRYLCKDGTYKLLRWTSFPEDGRLYAIAHVLDRAPSM